MALKAHNLSRLRHEGYKPLKLDVKMATVIQQKLDVGNENTLEPIPAADMGVYSKCGQNVFALPALSKPSDVFLKNVATQDWYKGHAMYDFKTGQPKAGSDATKIKKSDQFVNTVWKGTTKVAFGVRGRYVVAWYCEAAATPRDAAKTLLNVGRACNTQGYDSCYNDLQTKLHNVKRKHHETAGLEQDANAARAIQASMNRATFAGVMPAPGQRDPAYKDCAERVFYEGDLAKRESLSVTDRVTQEWYSGMAEYDFKTNQPKAYPAAEWVALPGPCRLDINGDKCHLGYKETSCALRVPAGPALKNTAPNWNSYTATYANP